MNRELTWEERRDLLTEDQRKGVVPNKYGYPMMSFGEISPFTTKLIHYWLDGYDIPRTTDELKQKS